MFAQILSRIKHRVPSSRHAEIHMLFIDRGPQLCLVASFTGVATPMERHAWAKIGLIRVGRVKRRCLWL